MSGAKHAPGPWCVRQTLSRGNALRYVVQRMLASGQPETRCSASGKRSLFKTHAAASRCARRLNEDEIVETELRAKYAGLPPLPNESLGRVIAKATGSAS